MCWFPLYGFDTRWIPNSFCCGVICYSYTTAEYSSLQYSDLLAVAAPHCCEHSATHCNTLQHTATHCNPLLLLRHSAVNTVRHRSTPYDTLQHIATHCNALKPFAVVTFAVVRPNECNALQHTATCCNTLQHTATHCNTLQHAATHCNTLHHTATDRDLPPSLSWRRMHPNECHTLHYTATHCNTLQHTATHCNTL